MSQYTRQDLIDTLCDEYDCEDSTVTENAVDAFLETIYEGPNEETNSVVLTDREDDFGNPIIEGDLIEDAEHVYSRQVYWMENVEKSDPYSKRTGEIVKPLEEWEM